MKIVKCPDCGSPEAWSLAVEEENEREIRMGAVACLSCHASFAVHGGLLDLLPEETMRPEVAAEVRGWDDVHAQWFDLSGEKDNFWLIEPDNEETKGIGSDEYLRRLPHFDRIAKVMQQNQGYMIENYRQLMGVAGIEGGERLLDLGAARCWTTREFAKLGCRCVAIDIATTKYVGLKSSDVYFDENPALYWERIRCDMEDLPFIEHSFDVVFCTAVLHHSQDPQKIIHGLWRILAPGGRVLVVNEPDYGLLDKKKAKADQDAEASDGVNENLYNQRMFVKFFKKAGFDVDFFCPATIALWHAYQAREVCRRLGLRFDPAKLQGWFEKHIVKHHELVRRFVGLGTMGIASKPR